jgi:AraC-like DNA-binding protein
VYREHAMPGLAEVVDAAWLSRPVGESAILPDGCIDLIFASGGRLFVSAIIDEPERYAATPGGWVVGVRFRPGMARCVLDVDPVECRDHQLGGEDVGLGDLQAGLADCRTPEAALERLTTHVRERVEPRHRPPARIRHAVAALAQPTTIAALAGELAVSPRTLQRELQAWTGLPPKVLARILRAQAAMKELRAGRRLAEVAAERGFADQAHMTRELRRLAGRAPSEIFKTGGEAAP